MLLPNLCGGYPLFSLKHKYRLREAEVDGKFRRFRDTNDAQHFTKIETF